MTPEETAAALAAKEQELADAKKALADKETELGKAQFTIVDLKKKKETVTPPVDPQIDPEVIKETAAELVKAEVEKFKIEQSADTFNDLLGSFGSTAEEREAVKKVYESQIQKTGFNREAIRADLENAFIIANKPKLDKTISELRQSNLSKITQANGGGSSQQIESKDQPNLSEAEKSWAKATAARRGISEDEVVKQLLANRAK
jgi:hypothetical protein